MKRFFSSKLNIFLTVLLIVVIGVAVWFGFNVFGNPFSKSVNAINFSGMNKTEVEKWVSDSGLSSDKYNYSYQYDESIEQDYVVYQSVKEGETITDQLTIIYSSGKDPNGTTDIANQVKNMSYNDARNWFIQNEYTNVTYAFETSETYELGKIISVTPSNATKNEAITVTVSYGPSIDSIVTTVPNFATYTKDEIEAWGKEYAIDLDIKYETSQKVDENGFISQSVAEGQEIKGGQALIVILSSGQSTSNTKTIPDTYIGLTEDEFKAKLKELGFTNLSKSSETYYAEGLNKDTIYYYEDGTFDTSRTINYALCAGKYTFDANEFNGKSKSDVEKLVTNLKNHNARINNSAISITFVNGDKNVDKQGQAYDCSNDGAKISCKLYTGDGSATALIPTDGRYLGATEDKFLSDCKTLGFTNFAKSDLTYYSTNLKKGTLYSYDDGELSVSKTINYALSEGAYSFNASDFNGLTTENANSKVKSLQNRNARINGSIVSIKFTDGTSDSSKSGQTYDCSNSGSVISCKVYTGGSSGGGTTGKKATIPGNLLGTSESNFLAKLKTLGFTNFAKSDITYYSTTLASGSVFSYDDGTFDTGKTINYALSVGPYTFNANDFNGLSTEEVNSKVKDLQNRNAARGSLKVNFVQGDSSSSNAGKVYNCSYSSNTISCYVYQGGSTSSVEVTNYAGQDAGNFKNWCNNNGLYYDITEVYDSGKEAGIVISQDPSSGSVAKGTTIKATVSKGAQPSSTGEIASINLVSDWYSGSSYDNVVSKVTSYLNTQGFYNLTFNRVDNQGGYFVTEIYVGNQKHTTTASYDTSNNVTIYVGCE